MPTYRLLLFGSVLFLSGLSVQAQTDSLLRSAEQATQRVQQRVDSLRQVLKQPENQAHAYHDSVLNRLRASGAASRRDSALSRLNQPLDTLSDRVQSLHQTANSKLPNELPSLPSLPAAPSAPPLPSLDQLSTQLTDRFSALPNVGSVSEKVGQYTQQVSSSLQQATTVAQDAPASLEQYLAQRGAAHQEALQPLAQQTGALESWQSNPLSKTGNQLNAQATGLSADQIKQQGQQQLREQATRHFAQHSEAVQEGKQQLSELKQKYKTVQSEQDKYERATSLRGEPWRSRLLLGSYFQFYREPSFQVDLSPFVGYRFNTRWSVGVGGSYRVPGSAPVYQGRVFLESMVYRGFALYAAYERSMLSPPLTTAGEAGLIADQHVLFGISKSYAITQKIRGTTLLLYRPGDIDASLQLSQWNLRTGFYLDW